MALGFFYSRLAWQSVRRNPGLSAVMVVGLALGIGTWVTARAAIQGAVRDPLPTKAALYHVSLVRPPLFSDMPHDAKFDDRIETGPMFTLSEAETRAIVAASQAPVRIAPTFAGRATVRRPDGTFDLDFVRFTTRDLFAMFDLGFAAGGPWTAEEDATGSAVVVIDEETAELQFGTAAALGKTVEIAGTPFRVVGVLAGGPKEKLFDQVYFRRETERYYTPFEAHRRYRIDPEHCYEAGRVAGPPDDPRANDLGIFLWAELPTAERRAAFVTDVEAAHLSPRVLSLASMRSRVYKLHPGYFILELFATVVLVASALNLVRLLLAKFSARTDLSGIHRALGATRRSIVMVHLVEAKLIGLAGGVLGLAFGTLGVHALNRLIPDRVADGQIDAVAVLVTVVVAAAVGICSGVYPAWRATQQAPAVFLRQS